MRLDRFFASKVYGHLDLDVQFNPDLTFLTGINGSGKTTVVQRVSALISPSLDRLAYTEYHHMGVELEHQGDTVSITADKEEDKLVIRSSKRDARLEIAVLPW